MNPTLPLPPLSPLLALDKATTRVPGREFGPFSLTLNAGERVAILGPSGAGKSTLLRLLAGESLAHGGQVLWHGEPLAAVAPRTLARQRAVLPQQHGVAFGMPVELVVALGRLSFEPDPAQPGIVAEALQAACASHLKGRRFDTLSGGEQARTQLARVMAQLWQARGGLLLVDEPLAALDPGLQLALLDALADFTHQRSLALVAVLHDINQALSGFDRLWLMQDGQVVADLPAGRAALPALEALFGIELRCVELAPGRIAVLAQRGKPNHAQALEQAVAGAAALTLPA